jgi:hypothetical protein
MGPAGEWFVGYSDDTWKVAAIPDALAAQIDELHTRRAKVRSMAFGAYHSWFLRFFDPEQSV